MLLADKYNVKGLVRICGDTIIENLQHDPSIIVEAAILGHQLNMEPLLAAAVKSMLDIMGKDTRIDLVKLEAYPKLMGHILEQCGAKLAKLDLDLRA